jgi:hypothetical protein
MACKSCGSDSQSEFGAEINIHIPKLRAPDVLVFPKVVICLRCGFTEFTLVESELRALALRCDTTV